MGITVELSHATGRGGSLLNCLLVLVDGITFELSTVWEMGITVELSTAIGRWESLFNCLLILGDGLSLLNCLLLLGDGDQC
jgi:hypothetical protein